ncbi:carbohydrate-binding protein [Streptomyces sp. GMY02]|uniref:glycerophosphodiester phosphodiesterase family protein n=1 Tax=Streptomyces sp. GMY02 TaxID=1333528 RepID=UPI001C2C9177|nr:glycerophosphodiester phosphodiesterase family protein [Streptomyces sp. GMY02]QXE35013.1 carbohydrate-binding protein [Streptomyces sp. GMY02]
MRTGWKSLTSAAAAAVLTVTAVWGAPRLVEAAADASPAAPATPAAPAAPAKPRPAIDRIHDEYLDHTPDADVMVVAHRGYWRGAPENSLRAIDLAVNKGAEVVEIDVQRTKDGQLVLMHDTSVDRTTNGTGNVSDLTLAQIKDLRLRAGLGGGQAALTDDRVPTLAEALATVKNRAMVNLDKGWAFRDQEYDLLVATGTLDHAIFKSSAPVAEVEAFLSKDPGILYSHVVDDANAASIGAFTGRRPQSYELIFDRLTDPQIQPAAVRRAQAEGRVWVNTMWYGLAAGYTDEASLIDPARGWKTVVDRHGASMIQTDNQEQLRSWLSSRHPHGKDAEWPALPAGTVRVQAEDYSTEGKDAGYHDLEDDNRGGAARKYEGVDLCDQAGALVMCWIRGGEWVKYSVYVPKSGTYAVSARVSSPYRPAGKFTLAFDDAAPGEAVDVMSTTSHDAFETQPVPGTQRLSKGTHEFTVRMDPAAYQNFNIDYFQLDRLR